MASVKALFYFFFLTSINISKLFNASNPKKTSIFTTMFKNFDKPKRQAQKDICLFYRLTPIVNSTAHL